MNQEPAKEDRLKQARKEYDWAAICLGAICAAPTLISIMQNGFDIELNWGFSHFVEFYRRLVTPLIDILHSPLRWLFDQLRLDWVIPQWLKDIHTISFVAAGLWVRGVRRVEDRWARNDPTSKARGDVWLAAEAIVLGFTGLWIVFAWWHRARLDMKRVSKTLQEAGVEWTPLLQSQLSLSIESARRVFRRSLLLTVGATFVFVVAFYVGNAILPQLAELGR